MIIQDSNISRLWHVKASEKNQKISQSQICPSFCCGGAKWNLKLGWSLQVPTANCLRVLPSSCP